MKKRGMNRRKFITAASVGVAGVYATLHAGVVRAMMGSGGMGGGGMGGGGMGGTTTTIVDPPPGASFFDIPNATKNSAGAYELLVKEARLRLNGTAVTLLTYNGMYPGPVIRAARGDMLKVRMVNMLPKTTASNILGHVRNITNIHTHGLHVTPSGMGDNMMMTAAPGTELNYEYDLALEEPGHLNFYHPHVHGSVAEQYWGGLAGPLVIDDAAGSPLSGYETHVMFIKDLTIANGLPEPYTSNSDFMRGKEGNLVMVNGQVNPVLSIRPGQVQRWQIVNACNARFLKLSLDRHSLWLVGTDGGLLDKPYKLSTILLAPGERVDVLVKADQGGGNFKLLSLPYARGGGSLQQVTLLTLAYGGISAGDTLPTAVNPAAARLNMNLSLLPRRQISLSMMMGRGYINGISYTDMDHAYTISSGLGTYEVWEIVNQSGMDHPFHQHVNSCQVLSVTGGDPDYASLYTTIPAWKDVVIIPKMGSATILVPVKDYDGMTMFHCHIVEHEDIGMMGVWDIGMM
ncbi:multicopper oxidase type 2 [Geobacter metallireducens RCH3]|uniref:Multicopper oxidase, type 2 n=1 Tax=Geobacter metallireducens (strain ATCC 53774 / DSM 7210 / GS-15) TaxID=269799 RepID=Q39TP1_GEOMG|nr:multicopper oxidase family protein [Geobacter metallireducens]ABB32383.1 multicopper oxidase, type 2 [Geobacter metallireducens GS-15]EHP86727.1 multicopper oxidase type 2 [Geobacter metallireducens RCH3]